MMVSEEYQQGYKKAIQDVINIIKKQASDHFFQGRDDVAVSYRDLAVALKELVEEEQE